MATVTWTRARLKWTWTRLAHTSEQFHSGKKTSAVLWYGGNVMLGELFIFWSSVVLCGEWMCWESQSGDHDNPKRKIALVTFQIPVELWTLTKIFCVRIQPFIAINAVIPRNCHKKSTAPLKGLRLELDAKVVFLSSFMDCFSISIKSRHENQTWRGGRRSLYHCPKCLLEEKLRRNVWSSMQNCLCLVSCSTYTFSCVESQMEVRTPILSYVPVKPLVSFNKVHWNGYGS